MEKKGHALEEAPGQGLGLDSTSATSEVATKQLDPDIVGRIRRLTPINQFPHHYQDMVIKGGEIINFARGSRIFIEGSQDDFVHYLVKGSVAILIDGQRVNHFSSHSEVSTFPLDEPGKRRESSAAVEHSAQVFRVRHAVLQRAADQADSPPATAPQGVIDITTADESESIVALLKKGLFANLPVETIQLVLSRIEEVDVKEGETVVMQGEPGDFFYLIKSGTAEVHRKVSSITEPVHLGTINPGDGICEEALVADQARNATVTMTSDGVLMKMKREDFNNIIRDPLLDDVPIDEAKRMVSKGTLWLDVRGEERFAESAMPGAINVPLPLLRFKNQELDRERSYVIYSDDPAGSAVAAFFLSARGFSARYVNAAVRPPVTERSGGVADLQEISIKSLSSTNDGASTTEDRVDSRAGDDVTEIEPAQPELYADTQSGLGLAQLVEEIRGGHEQIENEAVQDPTESTVTGASNISLEDTNFGLELDSLLDDSPAASAPAADAISTVSERLQDPIGKALNSLEKAFREEIENVRREERERIEQHVQARVVQIRKRAEEVIREKLLMARARDKEHRTLAEKRLRQNYEKLKRMANKITHQKAQIQRTRRQLQQKLLAADEVHRQLADLGQTMTKQLDNLEEMTPEEEIKFSR